MKYYAALDKQGIFWAVSPHARYSQCFIFDGTRRLVEVQVTENPNGKYYGWLATGADYYSMVQPHSHSFNIQFAHGYKAEEKNGRGKMVRLDIALDKNEQSGYN